MSNFTVEHLNNEIALEELRINSLSQPTIKGGDKAQFEEEPSKSMVELDRLSKTDLVLDTVIEELKLFLLRHSTVTQGQFETYLMLDGRFRGKDIPFDPALIPIDQLHKPWPKVVKVVNLEISFNITDNTHQFELWVGRDKEAALCVSDPEHPLIKMIKVTLNLARSQKHLKVV